MCFHVRLVDCSHLVFRFILFLSFSCWFFSYFLFFLFDFSSCLSECQVACHFGVCFRMCCHVNLVDCFFRFSFYFS